MKSLKDLLSDDPAWTLVREWIAAASNRVEVLPARDPTCRKDKRPELRIPVGVVEKGLCSGGHNFAPGSTAGVYAFSRLSVQRNFYRIPIP
jgi:hypothetical protein